MLSVEYILSLLDSDNSPDKIEEGLKLARKVECISIFFRPKSKRFNKNVWKNCAKAIAERSDEEIERYLYNMFLWLITPDAPGTDIIYDRMLIGKWIAFKFYYNMFLEYSRCIGNIKTEQMLLSLDEQKNMIDSHYVYENDAFVQIISKANNQIQAGKLDDVVDIDYIMWLLSDLREDKTQEKGVKLARTIDCLNAFIWPYICYDVFAPWTNCAKIINEKTDDELRPYIWELMSNLDNMTFPSALDIYNRLLKFRNIEEELESFEKYAQFDPDRAYKEVIERLKAKQRFL